MNQRAQYLLQVLEKIGSPLMASILQAPGRGTSDEMHKDAQRMAELLAKTTQASIEMSRAIDFSTNPEQGDSLRVALAALASKLIGAYFKTAGKVPGENDLKKITAALQTVLTYSENFMPGPDAAIRLDNLTAMGQQADPQQIALQYIHAFIPLVNAVTAFPFGQPEQKLIMDLSSRLVQRGMEMRESLFEKLPPHEEKSVELSLVTVLAKIYAVCHGAETARLMSLTPDQQAANGIGLDSVWKSFEMRVGIIEALAQSLIPAGQAGSGTTSRAPTAPTAPVAPVQAAPPASPPVPSTPPNAPAGNPLSMFAKKPEASPAPPQMPSVPPQSAAAPPPHPPANPGNPMAFFKAPPKKSDE